MAFPQSKLFSKQGSKIIQTSIDYTKSTWGSPHQITKSTFDIFSAAIDDINITKKRIEVAKALLEKNELSKKEIAEYVGYNSYGGFFKALKMKKMCRILYTSFFTVSQSIQQLPIQAVLQTFCKMTDSWDNAFSLLCSRFYSY